MQLTFTQSVSWTYDRLSFVKKFFAGVGQMLMRSAELNARMSQVERLQAKSDEELADMGIAREDIARYVFRDLLYL